MKNLKVSTKLITAFLIVVVLTVVVGGIGILGISQVTQANSKLYEDVIVPMPYLAKAQEILQATRVSVREMVIGVYDENEDDITLALSEIAGYVQLMDEQLNNFYATMYDEEILAVFYEGRTVYERDLVPVVLAICDASQIGDMETIHENLDYCRIYAEIVIDRFSRTMEMEVEKAEEAEHAAAALGRQQLIIIIVVLAIAAAAAMILAFYISGLISKPLKVLRGYMDDAGTKGLLEMNEEEKRLIPLYSQHKDEIGDAIKAAQSFFEHVIHISEELEKVSSGDLTVDVEVLSDEDVLGISLQRMQENLNNMFGSINSATSQVSVGAKQVADGAQSLAQGSTQQAASIEELSASIGEIAGKTKENAEMAERAAALAGSIMQNAEKGSRQMDDMMNAVTEINEASQSIGKVIKTIDDIAFQTNILALNAAVEAARAGQHGKGFAVVAEEVRNLAAKSADAAKETGDMIQNSMEKAELGSRIAGETAESLTDIVAGIKESGTLIGEIARSSDEQSAGISQINTGIDQVAQVVQQNSATAQQSAASSQQMSAQSSVLRDLVSQFRLKESGIDGLPGMGAMPKLDAPKAHDDDAASLPAHGSGTNFGKY